MGHQRTQVRTRLSITLERKRRFLQFRSSRDEGEPFPLDQTLRNRIPIPLSQLGFEIEEIYVRRPPTLLQVDDALRLRSEIQRVKRPVLRGKILAEQCRKRGCPYSESGGPS